MLIEVFFRALPLALPLIVVAGVVAFPLSRALSARVAGARWVSWIFVFTIGSFLAVTLSPSDSVFEGYGAGSTGISWSVDWPDSARFLGLSSDSLNLFAGAALGVSCGLMARTSRWSHAPLWIGVGLPFLAEAVQWLVPSLGRSGFLMADVVVNLAGVIPGLVIGWLAAITLRLMAPTGREAVGLDRHRGGELAISERDPGT